VQGSNLKAQNIRNVLNNLSFPEDGKRRDPGNEIAYIFGNVSG